LLASSTSRGNSKLRRSAWASEELDVPWKQYIGIPFHCSILVLYFS
jgi:hypothetical protein